MSLKKKKTKDKNKPTVENLSSENCTLVCIILIFEVIHERRISLVCSHGAVSVCLC